MKGILLMNLGSPDSPATGDVRRYLREFLMDGRVIDSPYPVRFAVVHGAILPFRPKKTGEAYHKVWLPEGSPLIVIDRRVQRELQTRIPVPVELAMRYQHPNVENALRNLEAKGVDDLLLIPLFPHYAMSSYESAVERVKELMPKLAPKMSLTVVPPFYDDPEFIAALVAGAEPYLRNDYDHLMFSFHGLPERHIRKSDPTGCHCLSSPDCCDTPSPAHATCYRAQCFKTVKDFVARAGIPEGKYSVAFQSRLGRDPWLKPHTDVELVNLAKAGVKRICVICPAFVTDCLETLEEIGMRGRESFIESGGEELRPIPCLNEHPLWLAFLERLSKEFLEGKAVVHAETPVATR